MVGTGFGVVVGTGFVVVVNTGGKYVGVGFGVVPTVGFAVVVVITGFKVVVTGGASVFPQISLFGHDGQLGEEQDSHFWHDGQISLAGQVFSSDFAHSFFSHFN